MIIFATILSLLLLLGLAVFQILLATGKPLGEYAWGGNHKILPKKLRISSLSSIVIYAIFAIFIVTKSGIAEIIPSSEVVNYGMWTMTVYMIIGIGLNAISRSKKERNAMTPVATLLVISFLIITIYA